MGKESAEGNLQLQNFAAAMYQICGELGAPANVLDVIDAAAKGKTFDADALLPFVKNGATDGQ